MEYLLHLYKKKRIEILPALTYLRLSLFSTEINVYWNQRYVTCHKMLHDDVPRLPNHGFYFFFSIVFLQNIWKKLTP